MLLWLLLLLTPKLVSKAVALSWRRRYSSQMCILSARHCGYIPTSDALLKACRTFTLTLCLPVHSSAGLVFPLLVPYSCHGCLHILRLRHRQLCCVGTTPFSYFKRSDRNRQIQTVIVVVLLAMDFWNCRVRVFATCQFIITFDAPLCKECRWSDVSRPPILEPGSCSSGSPHVHPPTCFSG